MANRAYLYSLSNRPSTYADRPECLSGLSEWAYDVPFSYRVLMSGNPKLCASLISDGFEDDAPEDKTRLYAISSEFELGIARFKKFIEAVRPLAAETSKYLASMLDETLAFFEGNNPRYLLLETTELDCMYDNDEAVLRGAVESEIEACRKAGAAVDLLPEDPKIAADTLKGASEKESNSPLGAFHGLLFNDNFDDAENDLPLGLYWTDVLFYQLRNKIEFEGGA
ncbi:hypothetical protein MO867_20315 [Microbulbifer sp. OS29]|uniref:DUF7822 domain-containing protein n=1 Tax=Microbulbifer okhotskensis TaxID=2926617 RepID=A0A9X2J7J7_9GAMM|nr:hypothetical protein [Microbulbifer okhotskensis]MCO1336674.1 hypothetical protein [Microbulbifer okhotskensis]